MKEVIFVLGKYQTGNSDLIKRFYPDTNKEFREEYGILPTFYVNVEVPHDGLFEIERYVRKGKHRYPYTDKAIDVTRFIITSYVYELVNIIDTCKRFKDWGWDVKIIKL
jgi:hypothetical protein